MTTRTLLFTGKGGVGKTTVAAATALRCAQRGQRVLVLSTDPAHSLADAFVTDLGDDVRPLAPGLWGQQLDAQRRLEASWADVRAYLVELLRAAGVEGIAAEELAVVPGLDELFALADIRRFSEEGDYDVVVVDCAPTAETLRLLSLPDVLEWYMERVFPVGRRLTRAVAPVLSRVSPLPVADDAVFGAVQRLYERLAGIKALLTDPGRASVRLVVTPERVVIAEARRTHTYLSLFGYPVDAVVANRVLPGPAPASGPGSVSGSAAASGPAAASAEEDGSGPADGSSPADGAGWQTRWAAIHAGNLAAIHEGFAPLPVLRAGWAPDEPVGLDRLSALADDLYGGTDPAGVLHEGGPFAVTSRAGGYVLRLDLPFAARDEVEVAHRPGELLVRVGPYRRAIVLPDALRRRAVTGARLRGGTLRVTFADADADADADGEAGAEARAGAPADRDRRRPVAAGAGRVP